MFNSGHNLRVCGYIQSHYYFTVSEILVSYSKKQAYFINKEEFSPELSEDITCAHHSLNKGKLFL